MIETDILYNNSRLENVQYYKYLGLQFHLSGKFEIAKQDLADRSMKAMFKLTSYFKETQPSFMTCMHLFDRLVKPVMMYSADICGVRDSKFSSLYKEMKSDIFEKCHLKFCRFILGVNRRTPIAGIYGDTGRYPMYISALTAFVKYWHRLSKCDEKQSLLYHAFIHNNNNNTQWRRDVNKCLNIGGLQDKDVKKYSVTKIVKTIVQKCKFEFREGWKAELLNDVRRNKNHGNKLRCYRTFKSNFGIEEYLKSRNVVYRKNICRLRLSSHKLHIETGRILTGNARLKPEDRICKVCTLNQCEDELHFILKCRLYSNERKQLLDGMKTTCPGFESLNDTSKFTAIMSCTHPTIITLLGKFVTEGFQKRILGTSM